MVSVKSQLLAFAAFFSFQTANACAADNCYRALFPCPSPSAVAIASAFCATITSGGVTATNYPTRATAACGTVPDRYISACKCGPTCYPSSTTLATSTTTSTSTSTSILTTSSACSPTPSNGGLLYGDFECGLGPWTTTAGQGFTIGIQSPGLTGNRSIQGQFTGPSPCENTCSVGRIDSNAIPITPNTAYKLTFATWMDGQTSGFIGLQINNAGQRTIDVNDYPQRQWNFMQHPWTSLNTTTAVDVLFEWYGPAARLDTITFGPLTAYCGPSPPPLGILPDGEFECGLGPSWSQQTPDPHCTAGVFPTTNLVPSTQGIPAFGSYAWQASYPPASPPNPANQPNGVSARLVTPTLPVTPGKTYLLAFTAYFDAFGIGFLGVQVNGAPVMTRDPGDRGQGTGWFAPNQVFWTAPAGVSTAVVTFEALMSAAGRMAVDSVVFVEAAQS